MTEPNRQSGENEERIIEIEIERLRPFKEHPFQVKDDKEMFLLQESIEKYGILNPLIVRPVPDGYYEIISGHRRKHAAEKLGYRKVPVIIRVLSEDDSILSMVDSNLHRERISYSPKATSIEFIIGGFHQGDKKLVIKANDDSYFATYYPSPFENMSEKKIILSLEEYKKVVHRVYMSYIKEWDKFYDNPTICDGTS